MPRTTRTNLGACECCGGSSSSGSSSSSSEAPPCGDCVPPPEITELTLEVRGSPGKEEVVVLATVQWNPPDGCYESNQDAADRVDILVEFLDKDRLVVKSVGGPANIGETVLGYGMGLPDACASPAKQVAFARAKAVTDECESPFSPEVPLSAGSPTWEEICKPPPKPYICATRAQCVGSPTYTWTRYQFGNEGWDLNSSCSGAESPTICYPEPPPDRPGEFVGEVVEVGCILDESTMVKECITRYTFESVPGWVFISEHDSLEECELSCNPPPPCGEKRGEVYLQCSGGGWVLVYQSGCDDCDYGSEVNPQPNPPCTPDNEGEVIYTPVVCVDAAAAQENPLP